MNRKPLSDLPKNVRRSLVTWGWLFVATWTVAIGVVSLLLSISLSIHQQFPAQLIFPLAGVSMLVGCIGASVFVYREITRSTVERTASCLRPFALLGVAACLVGIACTSFILGRAIKQSILSRLVRFEVALFILAGIPPLIWRLLKKVTKEKGKGGRPVE